MTSLPWDLRRWPINFNFLASKTALTVLCGRWEEAASSTLALVHVLFTKVGGIFRILREPFCWNASSLLRWLALSWRVSSPYVNLESTIDSYTASFQAIGQLQVQNFLSEVTASMAEAILPLISVETHASFDSRQPKYLAWFTFSRRSPFWKEICLLPFMQSTWHFEWLNFKL